MHTISIKNIGPIKEIIDLPITPYMLLIGPQASGKSTIAKALYLKYSIAETINLFYTEKIVAKQSADIDLEFLIQKIRGLVLDVFPLNFFYSSDSKITFKNNNEVLISLTIKSEINGFIDVHFSQELLKNFETLAVDVRDFVSQMRQNEKAGIRDSTLVFNFLFHRLQASISTSLSIDNSFLFIPAGRANLDASDLKNPMIKDYISVVNSIRIEKEHNMHGGGRRNIPVDSSGRFIFPKREKLIRDLSREILHGEYDSLEGEERIVHGEKYTPLKFASSGQQEVNGILLTILQLESSFSDSSYSITIEEPEAHLFPEAQHELMKLIALFGNKEGNNTTITTHSPYILTSFNNLIYAWQMGQLAPEQVEKEINIPKPIWVNPEHVQAFMVENGEIRSIIDPETKMISISELDSISRTINAEYDKLLDIELKHRKPSEA